MKILIIGLGSMGKRRLRLIQKIDKGHNIIGVDGNKKRCAEAQKLFDIVTYSSLEEAKAENSDVKAVFVCTSPLSHNEIIHSCLMNSWNVFTELNLVADGYEENMKLAKEKGCVLFLSSTFLYRDEISYICNELKGKEKLNYIYHIGQYLPDWHPWENYKDFFVQDKRTNGCREIMAIEFPWLIEVFGDVINYNVLSDKMSNLEITYHDNFMIQLQHEHGNKGVLIVDIVSPAAVRNLEIYGQNLYLSWNGTPDGLKQFDCNEKVLQNIHLEGTAEHAAGYSSFVIENAYQHEIEDFFDVLSNQKEQRYGFQKDKKILQLIDRIEDIK